MISVPEEYTISHFAGGAMPNDFRSIFSSSCSVPIWIFILGTKKQQKQNNQSISNNLSQTNIQLSKINFHGEFALDIAYIKLVLRLIYDKMYSTHLGMHKTALVGTNGRGDKLSSSAVGAVHLLRTKQVEG